MNKKSLVSIIIAGLIGAILGVIAMELFSGSGDSTEQKSSKKEPLYWVAPMDSNYKRDKPGKSPMGMDLVPVYEGGDAKDEVGTVTISPEVVNNLGVRTAQVGSGRLNQNINTVGYVQYDENQLVHISPRVEGWIEKLHVKAVGDTVKVGEPLYGLYSPTLVNAQEELVLALKRGDQILIDGAVKRLLALQVSQADINNLRKTRKVHQIITVAAPQSGVLDNLDVREGMFVKPGMSLMSIGQLEHIWVIGEVFERQATLVNEGDPVRVRLGYLPGREWKGQVDYVYPSLNTKTRTSKFRVHFNNPDAFLKPGMFAQIDIQTEPRAEALLIPREALIRTGDQDRVVLALGDGKFKSITVDVGRIGYRQVEILNGLNEGEDIVTSAQFLIDSESSKTSDFKRINQRKQQNELESKEDDNDSRSVWVSAQIKSLVSDQRMVTLKHEPIPDWQWPAMTMDFIVAESVDIDALKDGMLLQAQITEDKKGHYLLTEVNITSQQQTGDAVPTEMDQSQHRDMMQMDMQMPERKQDNEREQKEQRND